MKKVNYLKFALDLIIAIVFALLFNPRVLGGLTFHETAGIAIGVAILMHILLNVRWVKNVTLKILDNKLPPKVRFGYLLNILLLIFMAVTIVTGIFISRVLFPNISVGDPREMRHLHTMVSYLTLMLVGVHLGIHWQWVMNVSKKMFMLKGRKPRIGAIAAAIIVIGLLYGGYQWYNQKMQAQQEAYYSQQMQFNNRGQGGDNSQTAFTSSGFSSNEGSQNFQGQANGGFGDGFGRDGGFRESRGGNPLSVILTYFVIMGVIIVPTYYVDKQLFRKK